MIIIIDLITSGTLETEGSDNVVVIVVESADRVVSFVESVV